MMHHQGSLHWRFVFTVEIFLTLPSFRSGLQKPSSRLTGVLLSLLPSPPTSVSRSPHFVLSVLYLSLPTSSALRSCSTGDSLLSSAFIRSAKSAPALAPPLPVLLHHHHPLLPPLADQLAGTHSSHHLPVDPSAPPMCSSRFRLCDVAAVFVCPSVLDCFVVLFFARKPAEIRPL